MLAIDDLDRRVPVIAPAANASVAPGAWRRHVWVPAPRPLHMKGVPAYVAEEREVPVAVASSPWLGALTILLTLVFLLVVLSGQDWLWPQHGEPRPGFARWVYWGTAVWVLPIVPALLGLTGFCLGRRGGPKLGQDQPISTLVCFRVVTRGTNPDALARTVHNIEAQMRAAPVFPHCIEVVSDVAVDVPDAQYEALVVPRGYVTPRGSRYKARALQYALEASEVASDAWIVHLDEESHITLSCIRGVRDAVYEEESSGRHRIGQGCILYHRDVRRHPFLTLADSIRTADDLGRFRLQFKLGVAIFGLHGSFIVVRNSVEKAAGFDVGPQGSVTEDTYWALEQLASGTRFRWVDGYVVEQSTRSMTDFIKQRRRWFVGVMKSARHAKAPLWWRLPIAGSLAIWSVMWLFQALTIGVFAFGLSAPPWVRIIGDCSFATYLVQYALGCYINLHHHEARRHVRLVTYVAQLALVPAFAFMESLAVVYGMLSSDLSFHVVNK